MTQKQALTLEQVQFIAATVASHFGPKCDEYLKGKPVRNDAEFIRDLSVACTSSPALLELTVREAYPDAGEMDETLIVWRAIQVVAATLEAHDADEIFKIIGAEMGQHSTMLRREVEDR